MLPPPTTIATSTSRSLTSRTARASASMRCGSWPYSWSPISASPDSFSSTRLKAASRDSVAGGAVADTTGECSVRALCADTPRARGSGSADRVRGESGHLDVLARLARQRGAHLLDLQLLVAEVRLLEEHDLLVPLAQAALRDLVELVGRPAGVGGLVAEPLELGVARGVRHVLDLHPAGVVGGHDLQAHVLHERLDGLAVRDEVGVAADLDEDAL